MMIRILIVILIFMCSSYKPVLAEPTPSMSYLMNEPASLFDLGMFKLNKHLKDGWSDDVTVPQAVYDFHEDRILIGFMPFKEIFKIDKGKEYCRDIIGRIKILLLVDFRTGETHFPNGMTLKDIFFSHEGFHEKKNEPKNLGSDLAKIIDVGVSVPIEKGKMLPCRSPLLSKEIMYYE